jgi:hypothetical protein
VIAQTGVAGPVPCADLDGVRARLIFSLVLGVALVTVPPGTTARARAGGSCTDATGANGYAYAGHQSASASDGVRATITLTSRPTVGAGHVAGWVGVGGPGQGAKGADEWIQAGIVATPDAGAELYAEVARAGNAPRSVVVEREVAVGHSREVAVLEVPGRPNWWRVEVDGRAVTEPVLLPGSSGRWAPIATAESWNGGASSCSSFGFRFERVSVSSGGGSSWRPFVPAASFHSSSYRLRDLASLARGEGAPGSAARDDRPYGFVASSAS